MRRFGGDDDDDDIFEPVQWSDDDPDDVDAANSDIEDSPFPTAPSVAIRPPVPAHIPRLTIAIQAFLQHLQKIYPPLIKRRLKRFPAPTRTSPPTAWPTPAQCEAFDALIEPAEVIPGVVDDLVGALYRWDIDGEEGVRSWVEIIKEEANQLAQAMEPDWGVGEGAGKEQENKVGEWVRQWADMLEKWEFEGMDEVGVKGVGDS